MIKRLFDVAVSAILLLLCSPVIAVAALGVWLSSPGPIFYLARRSGRNGHLFNMFKLRTMHIGASGASAITAPGDSRVFAVGWLIRNLKIDELPQFWNIIQGDMSLVGPRPEDPEIVAQHYSDWMQETLQVAPGVTSPGAIFGYMMGDTLIDPDAPEASYVAQMLTPKLAIERAYIERATFVSDLHIIVLTAASVLGHAIGRGVGPPRADVAAAARWAPHASYRSDRK